MFLSGIAALFSCSAKHSVDVAQEKLNNEFPFPRGKPSVGVMGPPPPGAATTPRWEQFHLQKCPFFPLTLSELLLSDLWHWGELRVGL